MYTIKQLATFAGISTRTLRYYDQIGLLHPERITEAGYRIYTDQQVLLLQQILLYRNMGFSLSDIKTILYDPSFDIVSSLESQQEFIQSEQARLSQLLTTITNTIQAMKGGITLSANDTFKGLKEQEIAKNEEQYGEELRQKYGDDTMDNANIKMRNMSKWQWNRAKELGEEILSNLPLAMEKGIASKEAMHLCQMHQEWIQLYWDNYSKEAHLGLCKMYTEDERFTAYYDAAKSGAATFLLQAMTHYLNQ